MRKTYTGRITKVIHSKKASSGVNFLIASSMLETPNGKVPINLKAFSNMKVGDYFSGEGDLEGDNKTVDFTKSFLYQEAPPTDKERREIVNPGPSFDMKDDKIFYSAIVSATENSHDKKSPYKFMVMSHIIKNCEGINKKKVLEMAQVNDELYDMIFCGGAIDTAKKIIHPLIKYASTHLMSDEIRKNTFRNLAFTEQNEGSSLIPLEKMEGIVSGSRKVAGQIENFSSLGDYIVFNSLIATERKIAEKLGDIYQNGKRIPESQARPIAEAILDKEFPKLDYYQREAVIMGVCEPVCIVTGGPGTGKSTVMEAIVRVLDAIDGKSEMKLAAPTGKAARRLSQTTKRIASTIHKLLKSFKTADDTFEFSKEKFNDGTNVILDESSMLSILTAGGVMEAMPIRGKVIFAGDHNQLPSIDAGKILEDMMNAKINGLPIIPRVELQKVYRTGSGSTIANNARLIKDGSIPEFNDEMSFTNATQEDIARKVKSEVLKTASSAKDFLATIVLTAKHSGVVGTYELNSLFSAYMNPDGDIIPGLFVGRNERVLAPRVSDRVMITENKTLGVRENGEEIKVANGETGFIIGYNNKDIQIELDDGEIINWPISRWRSIILAYAITVHKSQGSEIDNVIMPISEDQDGMLDRTLIYTGVTRAKKKVALIGHLNILKSALSEIKHASRNTTLVLHLEGVAKKYLMKPKLWAQNPPKDYNKTEELKPPVATSVAVSDKVGSPGIIIPRPGFKLPGFKPMVEPTIVAPSPPPPPPEPEPPKTSTMSNIVRPKIGKPTFITKVTGMKP